ncbi:MAG: imidazole glycerol phosphate synthase subunit HisH [Verrucomicrobiota bacterium]|nr:imidazole glycerol phosphate synthase subunit HisH [Verrucomicrobiota bacterium]
MPPRIAIIDYGMCNLDSVRRAVEECGGVPVITSQRTEIAAADKVVLPGVGAFNVAMQHIRELQIDQCLSEDVVGKKTPLLGICLGMQILASSGTEGGESTGLGFIEGQVRRLEPVGDDNRIPHVGWNQVVAADAQHPLFKGIRPGSDFYFVHSFHFCAAHESDRAATTPYAGGFTSVVGKGPIFGVQFHPEKSQKIGFQLLRNFIFY